MADPQQQQQQQQQQWGYPPPGQGYAPYPPQQQQQPYEAPPPPYEASQPWTAPDGGAPQDRGFQGPYQQQHPFQQPPGNAPYYGGPPPPQGYGAYPAQQGAYPGPQGPYPGPQGDGGNVWPGQYPPQQYYQNPPMNYPPQGGYWGPPQGYGGQPYAPGQPVYGAPPQNAGPQGQQYPQQGQYPGAVPIDAAQQGAHDSKPHDDHAGKKGQKAHKQKKTNLGGPPTPPSPGYDRKHPPEANLLQEAYGIRAALHGLFTNEKKIIGIIRSVDPVTMNAIRMTYNLHREKHDLITEIKEKTHGSFETALCAVVRGPLLQDVACLHHAFDGIGTNEHVLDDVLLNRSNSDMRAIKAEYQDLHGITLEKAIDRELSMKTKQMFEMVVGANRAEDFVKADPEHVKNDVLEIHHATQGLSTDPIEVCSILTHRNDKQLCAISSEFQTQYSERLEDRIKKKFSGHMEQALLRILHNAESKTVADATAIMEAMQGFGTNERLLIDRVVRAHWDRPHMQQVILAFRSIYHQDLAQRIRSETSGHLEELLLALIDQ